VNPVEDASGSHRRWLQHSYRFLVNSSSDGVKKQADMAHSRASFCSSFRYIEIWTLKMGKSFTVAVDSIIT
jgi:hypothetical protein